MTYRKLTLDQTSAHGEPTHPPRGRTNPSQPAAALGPGPAIGPQIVCMSATMGGLDTMCRWLDARE